VTAVRSPPLSLAERDRTGLAFTAEMYGVQLDQLAAFLGLSARQARGLTTRWATRGLADTAVLSPGQPWTWLTRAGLQACGTRYSAAPPALPRLPHIRAVTAVRLAIEAAPGYAESAGYWRSERRLRSRLGGRLGAREHLPDAEVHWPDAAAVPWAGECWAIEVELTAKTISRTTAIMRELLARTGDYGSPAAQARVAGQPTRHARVLYVCSPAALGTVLRSRAQLGGAAGRVEVRGLPAGAVLPAPRTSARGAAAKAARTARASA
jgi:hypothetical protein